MSCSSSQNAPLLSLWAVRLGANTEQTREAFHTALAAHRTGEPEPDQGDVAAFLRRHIAATAAAIPPGADSSRVHMAMVRVADIASKVESGDLTVDGSTFAAWKEVGDAFGPLPDMRRVTRAGDAESGVDRQSQRAQRRTYAGGGRRPYHRRFTRFNTSTLEATEELFQSRPSRLSEEGKLEVFNRWLDRVSDAYGMDRPALEYNNDTVEYGVDHYSGGDHTIRLANLSVTTLLHEFRHAMQREGSGPPILGQPQTDWDDERERVEVDARAWSLSLYYQCRPQLMERLVREGKILHLPAEDL